MRTISACLFVFVLCTGCALQPTVAPTVPKSQASAWYALTIRSKNSTFTVGDEIKVMIYIENQSIFWLHAKGVYQDINVIVDGKEYRRSDESITPWKGPRAIPEGGDLHASLTLSEFMNTRKVFTVGKHTVSITLDDAVSNPVIITIIEEGEDNMILEDTGTSAPDPQD